jgi:hypothetical protein
MTSACSPRLRQRACPPTGLPDRNADSAAPGHARPRPGSVPRYGAVPRHPSTCSLARCTRPTRSASPRSQWTSQETTTPGSGSRRRASSDGPIVSVSVNPTRRDLAGRTHYPFHGDERRPHAACSTVHKIIEADYRRPEDPGVQVRHAVTAASWSRTTMVSHLILEPRLEIKIEIFR